VAAVPYKQHASQKTAAAEGRSQPGVQHSNEEESPEPTTTSAANNTSALTRESSKKEKEKEKEAEGERPERISRALAKATESVVKEKKNRPQAGEAGGVSMLDHSCSERSNPPCNTENTENTMAAAARQRGDDCDAVTAITSRAVRFGAGIGRLAAVGRGMERLTIRHLVQQWSRERESARREREIAGAREEIEAEAARNRAKVFQKVARDQVLFQRKLKDFCSPNDKARLEGKVASSRRELSQSRAAQAALRDELEASMESSAAAGVHGAAGEPEPSVSAWTSIRADSMVLRQDNEALKDRVAHLTAELEMAQAGQVEHHKWASSQAYISIITIYGQCS